MKKLIILNHKMNLEYDNVYEYIKKINEVDTTNNIIILPSNIYLESFINNCNWGIGAQNVNESLNGSYTGEISTIQLKSLGIEYAMIGHYERRKYYNEDDELINKKLHACLDSNIAPILCFGDNGNIDDIKLSLDNLLKGIDNIHFIIFAYEPLKVKEENIDTIKDNIEKIYNYLYDKYKVIPNLVYGGGISSKNINKLLDLDKINGILVGKVSSDIEKIIKIINSINK